MKQTFTLVLAIILSTGMYAYPAFSKLTISSTTKSTLRVIVDGNKYTSNNSSNALLLNNFQPGYHTIKIYQALRNFKPAPGNYSAGYKLIYNANVYVKPQYHVDIVVNRFGRAFKDEQPVVANSNSTDTDDDWSSNNWNDNDGNTEWNNDGNNNYTVNREMNTQQFERFKESLKKESFDNTRTNIAKQVLDNNYFTAVQIKEVVGLFNYENSKLDVAKYAYKNTIDKNQYYIVSDAFTFSNSKDELMMYIKNYK